MGIVSRVTRSDVSRLGKFSRTGAGAVRIPATISRTGVQDYPEQGLREFRPDSEVFAPESLASLGSVPVTLNHPPEGVSPANAGEYSIGHVTDSPPEARVQVDGSTEQWVKTTLVVADGKVLDEIDRSEQSPEVSCGYTCDLDMTPGVAPNGEKYDAVQRNIRFNHVAILARDSKARAGAEAKLRLDNKGKTMKIIVIDGVEYEQNSDKHVAKIQQDAAAAVASVTARADKAEAQRDAAVERADKAEKAASVEAIDAKVEARFALLSRAAKFLPATYDTKGKTDAQVRADAVATKIGADKLTGKSEAYIEARFDALCEVVAEDRAEFHKPTKADGVRAVNVDNDDNAFRALLATQAGSADGEE